jgi:hypothetical protein
MSLVRSFLSLLVAASIAVLPVIGGAAAAGFKAGSMNDMAAMVAMPANDMECCPQSGDPARKQDKHGCPDACAFMCFSVAGVLASNTSFPPFMATLNVGFATTLAPAHADSPPFRPPRA